jgi:hypothetical protein
MKRTCLTLGLLAGLTQQALAASPEQPAVVELFTSQGCSSCPPANANLRALADRPDVLALSFSVTYWDHLGWKDTFARPEFTQRQYEYETPLGEDGPFTPQIVVDGQKDTVGTTRSDIEKLIAATHRDRAPVLQLSDGNVHVGAAANRSAQVWLVRYDPRLLEVPVGAGENSGATLPHRNVVRGLVLLGMWRGAAQDFALPKADAGLKTAVLLQAKTGGAILAVARN